MEPVLLSHVYPEDERLEWSAGRIESWDAALVRVETDTGLVGHDPENAPAIREDLYDRNLFRARGGLPLGVIGAIEIAVYDLLQPDVTIAGGFTETRRLAARERSLRRRRADP